LEIALLDTDLAEPEVRGYPLKEQYVLNLFWGENTHPDEEFPYSLLLLVPIRHTSIIIGLRNTSQASCIGDNDGEKS
jgi:hypothetical protein